MANPHLESTRLLRETQEVLVLDLLTYVVDLDKKYGDAFIASAPGIYLLNRIEPAIRAGEKCYILDASGNTVVVKNLDNVETDVFNIDGEILIPKYIMKRKDKFLKTKSTLPIEAIKIIKFIVREFIDSLLPYCDAHDYDQDLKELIKPEYWYLITEGYLESECRKILDHVGLFIKTDIWNMYFMKNNNTDLIIEKSVDFRIFDWTRKLEEAKITLELGEL